MKSGIREEQECDTAQNGKPKPVARPRGKSDSAILGDHIAKEEETDDGQDVVCDGNQIFMSAFSITLGLNAVSSYRCPQVNYYGALRGTTKYSPLLHIFNFKGTSQLFNTYHITTDYG